MNTKIITTLAVVVAVVGIGYFLNTRGGTLLSDGNHHGDETTAGYEIYPGIVVDKIKNKDDIILLDVRTPEEYAQVHLENALLLPVQELSAQSLAKIGIGESAKDREIYIYCRSGARSKTAYDIMASLGYTNIKSIAGGMIHWQEDTYPFTQTGAYTGSHTTAPTTEATSQSGPTIALDRTFHDFGVVPQYGGTVTATFTVTNTGKDTLIVGDITTSCSCTSASISKTSIESGNTAQVTVVFDPNFHEEPLGVFKRTVFIATNDTKTPDVEITIQVDIAEGK